MSIFSVTFVVLLVLKLLEVVSISWLLVFSPILAWMALWLSIMILTFINEVNK